MISQDFLSLDNCASEPIHIPGLIQPHGALLVLNNELEVSGWSINVPSLLGISPTLKAPAQSLGLSSDLIEALQDLLDSMPDGEASPIVLETYFKQHSFDTVIHAHLDRIIIEFEHRDENANDVGNFTRNVHRTIDRLKRQKNIDSLLQVAVEEVEKLTGFDRVMAYIFRHDDSGDVVAEKCAASLDPYLGRRYPASDIPAQARRLYTINTLRLISDVSYEPIPLVGESDADPLDMSHCILRSVSPIHIEYLCNIGVQASMSVSIIVNGKLWGMIACHHLSPLQVPYPTRMTCDVIAQIIASNVGRLQEVERAELHDQSAKIHAELMETLLNEDDVLRSVSTHADALRSILKADALAVSQHGKILVFGEIEPALVTKLHALLPEQGDDLIHRSSRDEWPEALQKIINKWVGLLALRFDPATGGWIMAFRLEQIETVRWGGQPEKMITHGPLGPRLTPRGSFEEWKAVVRDTAEPWDEARLKIARLLLSALLRISNLRHAEMDSARMHLMAILGHDLRDPLNSIHVASHLLKEEGGKSRMGEIIRNSSGRMERLIAQVLDMSRLGTGIGLSIQPLAVDIAALLKNLVEEAKVSHPGADYKLDIPSSLIWHADSDRLAQAVSNLLGNSRHHGHVNSAVILSVRQEDNQLVIKVCNEANEIPSEIAENLFSPFKKSSASKQRAGLGLGLYIANEIVNGHQGKLTYEYQAPHVIFKMVLPALENQ